jgi:hypothetical protein
MRVWLQSVGMGRATGAVLAFLVAGAIVPQAAAGPFDGISGRWLGSGSLLLKSGTKEPLRCRAQNVLASENNLQQALRCASDSYKFEVNAYIVHNDGIISGRWDELTQSVEGDLKGNIANGRIDAQVKGLGFTAKFVMEISATRQSVTVTPDGDFDIREVRIDLKK